MYKRKRVKISERGKTRAFQNIKGLFCSRITFDLFFYLVNNAGVGSLGPVELDVHEDVKAMFATNTFGPMLLTKKLLPHWKKNNSGHAIVVTSIAGMMGFAYNCSYSASKFAIEGFYEGLALECSKFNLK